VLGIMAFYQLVFKDNRQVNKKIDRVLKELNKWELLRKVLV
jgi:hypothetical protein